MKQFFLLLMLITINGCSSLGYYWQAMNGHAELLNRQRPFAEVLQDDATRVEVKQRIQLASEIRQFARRELQLPDNDSYTHYADLERPYALWNVVAAPARIDAPAQIYMRCGRRSKPPIAFVSIADQLPSSLNVVSYHVLSTSIPIRKAANAAGMTP